MKKLFSFLCLLMLGMGMSAWAYTMYTPTKAVLTRIGSTNNFRIELRTNVTYAALYVTSVDMGAANALNGAHNITNTNCSNDWFMDNDQTRWWQPNGTITFNIVSGSSNADYKYNISVSGYGYQGGCGYIDDNHKGNLTGSWSNVPVEVYESDETTPIDLIDEVEPDYLAIRWDNPSHTKTLTYVDDNNGLSGFEFGSWKLGEKFFKIEGYDPNKANYYKKVRIWFKVTATETYSDGNGGTITGPAPNTYQCKTPGFDGIQQYVYLNDNDNRTANYVVTTSYYGQMSSTLYDKNGTLSTRDFATTDVIYVTKNADGTMYIKCVDKNGDIFCTFGKEPNEFEITVLSEDDNLGTTSGSGIYRKNSNQTISATATAEGYEFVQWNDGNTENPRTIQVTENKTYTATFDVIKPKYTITVTSADASKGTVTGGGLYREGATATIIAIPNSGYVFDKWVDGDGNEYDGQALDLIGIDASASFTAYFKEGNAIIFPATWFEWTNNGYSDIIGKNDEFEIRIESHDCTFAVGSYSVSAGNVESYTTDYYTYLKQNGNYVNINNSSIELKISGNSADGYYAEISMEATNGTKYLFNLPLTYVASKQYTSDSSWDYDFSPLTFVSTSSKSDGALLTAKGEPAIFYDSGSRWYFDPDDKLYLYFNLGGQYSYIPTNNKGYIIQNSGSAPYVLAFNGSTNQTSTYTWRRQYYMWNNRYVNCDQYYVNSKSQGCYTDIYYYILGGKVTVINPNHKSEPMYVEIDAYTSQMKHVKTAIGTLPALYPVTLSNDEKGTISISCAENHGYSEDGSLETGNYYYNGTKLYLSATVADPANYRFKGWNIGGTLYTDVAQTDYEYTVSEAVTIQAVFERIYAVTITQPATGTLTVKNGNTTINSGDKIGEGTKLTVTYSGNGYDATISPVLDANNQFTVSSATTVSAVLTAHTYTITYNGLEGATNTNPTSYNVESETIVLANPGARAGYTFAGWIDEDDNAITQITQGSTGNRTLTATWTKATTLDLYDNKDATYYNNIKDLDEKTYDVTLYRTFKPGRWSTICLPFDYYQAQMEGHPLKGNINEYLYSEGNATSGGSGLTLYFKSAKSIEAGKPYLVYNTTGDDIVNLTFAGVTIDTDLDTKDADIDYILSKFSYKQSGSISLVGTFRKIKLPEQNHAYMGLMYDETAGKTKIYYPGTNANVPAYRAFFHIDDATPAQQRVRIVVDGVDMDEMLIDNGEIVPTTENLSADRAPRKYIRNGVLVIERNGVTYDAQGKKL